ncbi:unnamed protein product [Ixodes persulcatus]
MRCHQVGTIHVHMVVPFHVSHLEGLTVLSTNICNQSLTGHAVAQARHRMHHEHVVRVALHIIIELGSIHPGPKARLGAYVPGEEKSAILRAPAATLHQHLHVSWKVLEPRLGVELDYLVDGVAGLTAGVLVVEAQRFQGEASSPFEDGARSLKVRAEGVKKDNSAATETPNAPTHLIAEQIRVVVSYERAQAVTHQAEPFPAKKPKRPDDVAGVVKDCVDATSGDVRRQPVAREIQCHGVPPRVQLGQKRVEAPGVVLVAMEAEQAATRVLSRPRQPFLGRQMAIGDRYLEFGSWARAELVGAGDVQLPRLWPEAAPVMGD